MKPSIYGLTRQELIEWAEEHGEKKFRATQIWEWLYRKRVQSFEEMTNLSKSLIETLNDQFVINPLKQRIVQESADGTVKYLFELPDGMLIETVLMRQHYGIVSLCHHSGRMQHRLYLLCIWFDQETTRLEQWGNRCPNHASSKVL